MLLALRIRGIELRINPTGSMMNPYLSSFLCSRGLRKKPVLATRNPARKSGIKSKAIKGAEVMARIVIAPL